MLGFEKLVVLFGATAVLAGVMAPPASAVVVGPLEVRIDLYHDGGAEGYVAEDLTGASYTSVLTVTGFQTDGARHGTVHDFDTATGNPSETSVQGGFDSTYAVVVYTLTWVSAGGTVGVFVRACGEALNTPTCTPT